MHPPATIAELQAGLAYAKRLGLVHLIKSFQSKIDYLSVSTSLQTPAGSSTVQPKAQVAAQTKARTRAKIVFLFYNPDWCDGTISESLAKRLRKVWDVECYAIADRYKIPRDADLYILQGIGVLAAFPVPYEMHPTRVISIVPSERVLEPKYLERFSKILGHIPLNKQLERFLKERLKLSNVSEVIENGIETTLFTPASAFPKEFIVGASGNFSNNYFDDWKGFSKYIVPACQRAKVKLRWCGWTGKCTTTGLVGQQLTAKEMPNFYRNISCLVSMSKSEACSSVTFEAMASGLPIISTQVGWHAEICRKEILWVRRPKRETPAQIERTIDALAQKILYLKNNPMVCVAMGKASRKFAEKHSWDVVAQKWKAIISHFLNLAVKK